MDVSSEPRAARRAVGKPRVKTVNLALQGGGAHGAFAWGVLDRLIEDGRLGFEGVSATSAGAMNAAVLASGWLQGGGPGARKALAAFWHAVSETFHRANPWRSVAWLAPAGFGFDQSITYTVVDLWTRMFSPYQLNPWNHNPLRQVLEQHVDFEGLRRQSDIQLFLAATNVETCKVRIFRCADLTPDAVLASACLPFMFQAVEIEGQFYWDGGYLGNPAIYPLIYHCESPDVVIVHLNPIVRRGCPRTAAAILDRINEVSFNSSLMREMRAIAFVTALIDKGKLAEGEFKRMRIHSIRADEEMVRHGVASKFNADWAFLTQLRDQGRAHAARWLDANFDALGRASSVDVRAEFL